MNERERRAIVDLAKLAGDQIIKFYLSNEVEIEQKSDNSPLTNADKAANHIILRGLKELYPNIPAISEESTNKDLSDDQDIFWLIDPLDGTREFLNKNDEFTVNIALIVNKVPVFGVVHAPALKLTYYGQRGEGAWRSMCDGDENVITETIQVSASPLACLRVLISRSHADAKTTEFLNKIPNHELVPAGSSLKFCKLADGSADIYPRIGNTMEWDTAAGQCVLEAAGGKVVLLDGTPLTYVKQSWRNPYFIAVGGDFNKYNEFLI